MFRNVRWAIAGLTTLASLASANAVAQAASAQAGPAYPERPITMVVPYPSGATTDLVARIVAEGMRSSLAQPVIVENRGGASGNIGSAHVAKAAADGYTILLGTDATHGGANYYLAANPQFHPVKDFAPIMLAAQNIVVLVAHPSFPGNNIKELIDYARKNPDTLSYGSSGNGSPHHLAGVLMNQLADINIMHVPYKGGGPAVVDVLGNQIPLAFASLASVSPYIKSGKLKALGVTQATRYQGAPDIPAIGETINGFDVASWLAFFAPAGTPQQVIETLNGAMAKGLKDPKVQEKLNSMGLFVVAGTPEELRDVQASYFDNAGRLIKSSGLQPQ